MTKIWVGTDTVRLGPGRGREKGLCLATVNPYVPIKESSLRPVIMKRPKSGTEEKIRFWRSPVV